MYPGSVLNPFTFQIYLSGLCLKKGSPSHSRSIRCLLDSEMANMIKKDGNNNGEYRQVHYVLKIIENILLINQMN